jgi:hypothetical protein
MPQFVLDEDELAGLYSCISGEGSVVTSMMLLSKPEKSEWSAGNVYDDCYLLTLSKEDLIELISHVSEESAAAEGFALIAGNLERGALARGDEDADDDDDDDDDDDEDYVDESAPGGRLSAFNADGSSRQIFRGEGYCVSCREPKVFEGYVAVADSGRKMAMGICPSCGTRINKIVGE